MIFLFLPFCLSAKIISVGNGYDYETISEALDIAEYGDEILVDEGIYQYENWPLVLKSGITLRRMNEDTYPELHGNGTESVISTIPQRADEFVVEGFRISGGGGSDRGDGSRVGGGVSIICSRGEFTDCIFSGNRALFGGGIYHDSSILTFTRCQITTNTVINGYAGGGTAMGAGVYGENGWCSIPGELRTGLCIFNDCTISGNEIPSTTDEFPASGFGAGMALMGGMHFLERCRIENNTGGARSRGGVAFLNVSDLTMSHCRIRDNWTSTDSAFFVQSRCSITISNCIFSDGEKPVTASRENSGESFDVRNCLFTKHKINSVSGEVLFKGAFDNISLDSCIIWNNEGSILTDDYTDNLNYCCVQGSFYLGGEGNIRTSPLFANPENGHYHLLSKRGRWNPNTQEWIHDGLHSPCIDAGNPTRDFSMEPGPNGGRINIGPFGNSREASKGYKPASAYNPCPENGSSDILPNVLFSWEAGPTAASFDFYLWRDDDTLTTEIILTEIPADMKQVDIFLNYSQDYVWRVDVSNEYGTTKGQLWKFGTHKPQPSIPSNPTPSDHDFNVSRFPNLKWSESLRADYYNVKFWKEYDDAPSTPVYTRINNPEVVAPFLLDANTTYTWQVEAVNPAGMTQGPVWKFTTIPPAPGIPRNPFPEEGDVTGSGQLILSWDKDNLAEKYIVEIYSINPLESWKEIHPENKAEALSKHIMAFHGYSQKAVIFGGFYGSGFTDNISAKTWLWDENEWLNPAFPDWPDLRDRHQHNMAYDGVRHEIILFGYDGTWKWKDNGWEKIFPATEPSPRYHHAMTFDSNRNRIILYGGFLDGSSDESGLLNDMWVWDGSNWLQLHPETNPGESHDLLMAYDRILDEAVLLKDGQETWIWDGKEWELKTSGLIAEKLTGAAMTWHGGLQKIVLYGKSFNETDNKMFTWNGISWDETVIPGASPEGRQFHAVSYNPAEKFMILYGGERIEGVSRSRFDDTWIYPDYEYLYQREVSESQMNLNLQLESGKTYWWRVTAVNSSGETVGSFWDFTIKNSTASGWQLY